MEGGWLVKIVTVGHSGEEDSCLRLDHCNVRTVMNELYEGLYEVYLHVIASLKSGGGILDCAYTHIHMYTCTHVQAEYH